MIELTDKNLIKKILPHLRTSTVKGESNDGCFMVVYYKAFEPQSPRQIEEAAAAKKHNLDLHVYVGPLEGINFPTKKDGSFVFTILSLTRVKDDEYKYRSFNVDKGEIVKLIAYPDLTSQIKTQAIQAVEIPVSWLRSVWEKIKSL